MFRIINIPFCSKSTTNSAAANRWIPLDIIQAHILNRLDGATLSSISCASSQLLSLCSEDRLWRNICNSTWPSTTDPRVVHAISAFPSAHRSFHLESFPSVHHQLSKKTRLSDTSELISAVDIYYKDQVLYSKVLVTETVGDRFLNHPLVVRLLDLTEIVTTPLELEGDCRTCMSLAKEHLKVSWIVIDPNNKRAVNIANHKAVDSRIRWWNFGDNIELRYATVAAVATGKLVQYAVSVTCRREETGGLHVKRVNMHIEDINGKTLSGKESVGIIQAAMEGRRRRIDIKMETDNYEIFSNKERYREELGIWKSLVALLWCLKVSIIVGICFISLQIYCYLAREAGRVETSDLVTSVLIFLLEACAHKYLSTARHDALIQ